MISFKHLLLEAIIVGFIFRGMIVVRVSCVLSWFTDAGPISGEFFKDKFKQAGHTPGQSLRNQVVNVDRHPGWSMWILDHKRCSHSHKSGCKQWSLLPSNPSQNPV